MYLCNFYNYSKSTRYSSKINDITIYANSYSLVIIFFSYIPERNPEEMKLRDFNKSIIVILINEEDEIKSPQKRCGNLISFSRFMRITQFYSSRDIKNYKSNNIN